jgi:hypothetical protein
MLSRVTSTLSWKRQRPHPEPGGDRPGPRVLAARALGLGRGRHPGHRRFGRRLVREHAEQGRQRDRVQVVAEAHRGDVVEGDLDVVLDDLLLGGKRGGTSIRLDGRPFTPIEMQLVRRMVEIMGNRICRRPPRPSMSSLRSIRIAALAGRVMVAKRARPPARRQARRHEHPPRRAAVHADRDAARAPHGLQEAAAAFHVELEVDQDRGVGRPGDGGEARVGLDVTVESNLAYSTLDLLLGGKRGGTSIRLDGRPFTPLPCRA